MQELGTGDTWLSLSKNPRSVHKLLQLHINWCTVGLFTSNIVSWWVKFDHFIFDIVTFFNLESVGTIQTLQFLDIVLLFRILDVECFHEEVGGVASLGYDELARAEVVE